MQNRRLLGYREPRWRIKNCIDHDMIKQIKIMFLSFSLCLDSVWVLQQTSSTRFLGHCNKKVTLCCSGLLKSAIEPWLSKHRQPWKPPVISVCMKGPKPFKLTGTYWNLAWYLYRGHLDEFHNIPISGNPQMLGAWISYLTRDPPNPGGVRIDETVKPFTTSRGLNTNTHTNSCNIIYVHVQICTM